MIVGRALALSALVVIAVLSIGDVLLIPMDAFRRSHFDLLAMLALSVKSHVVLLAPLLGLHAALLLGAFAGAKRPDIARWLPTLAMVIGLVCAFRSYLVLLDYEPFRGHLPFIAAWFTLGVLLAVAYRVMCSGLRRRTVLVLAALGLAGAFAAAWANVTQYPGAYPALHRSLTTVSYLLGHAGVALIVIGRPARTLSPLRTWAPSAAAGLVLIAMFVAALASARAVTLYRNFTILGRAAVVDAREGVDVCLSPPATLDERAAREVFARHSRMPPLPPSFQLVDYNVLLVTIESLRYDETSLSGRSGATPNLARIVERGAFSFHDAMAPSSGTLQSVASLISQIYPTHTNLQLETPRWTGELRPAAVTVAETFRASGYTTFAGLHAPFPGTVRGGEQGFELLWMQPNYDKTKAADEELAAWTLEAIDRSKEIGKKFFGWVFFVGPHDPYYERRSPGGTDRERYRQEIEHVDAQLGRIYDHLEASGLLASTIVIVTSDHGEEFKEHGHSFHSTTLHDELLHVPLVVWLPPLKGSAVTGVTSTLYLFPWLLTAGDEALAAAATRALTDHIGPMMNAVDGAVVAELMGVDRRSVALIWDDRKIMHGAYSNFVQMYDRRNDRREQRDLGRDDFPFQRELEALGRYEAVRVCRQRATEVRKKFHPAPNHTRPEDVWKK